MTPDDLRQFSEAHKALDSPIEKRYYRYAGCEDFWFEFRDQHQQSITSVDDLLPDGVDYSIVFCYHYPGLDEAVSLFVAHDLGSALHYLHNEFQQFMLDAVEGFETLAKNEFK